MSEAVGHTISQSAFAKIVGASSATIQSVELGRLKVSPSLARRIAVACKVAPASLMAKRGKPKDYTGAIYTADSYRNWRTAVLSAEGLKLITDYLADFLKLLFAAANAPNKSRAFALLESFREWFDGAQKEFDLGPIPLAKHLRSGKDLFVMPTPGPNGEVVYTVQEEQFRRLTGLTKHQFDQMIEAAERRQGTANSNPKA